jgi:hypothetical protein
MGHFKSVQAKLGNMSLLNKQIESDSFLNLDCMTMFLTKTTDDDQFFGDLIEKIRQFVDKQQQKDKKTFILIDDLSIPMLLGSNDRNILKFVQNLTMIDGTCLNINMQSFNKNELFIKDLSSLSDFYAHFDNLTTGYSKNIHGQVNTLIVFFHIISLK